MAKTGLEHLSLSDLQKEIQRRQKHLHRQLRALSQRRDRLLREISDIESQITDCEVEIKANGGQALGRRKRPRNEMNLADALASMLRDRVMTVTEVSVEVQKAGYKTTSPNFRTIVNQTLLRTHDSDESGAGSTRRKGKSRGARTGSRGPRVEAVGAGRGHPARRSVRGPEKRARDMHPGGALGESIAKAPEILAMRVRRRSLRLGLILLGIGAIAPAVMLANGCSSTIVNRDPTGEVFPSVVGESLEKERTELPGEFASGPVVILVGYKQGAQFDIDRWVMGLLQSGAEARIVEIPTIPGLVPTFASKWIDDGMRSGIPREEWGSVVTLYGGAASPVAQLTGTEHGRLARVLVLDEKGTIVWFDDEGYSPRKAMAIAELVESLDDS